MKPKLSTLIAVTWLGLLLASCGGVPTKPPEPTTMADKSVPTGIRNVRTIDEPFKQAKTEHQRTINCDGLSPTTTIERSLMTEQTTSFEVQVGAGSLVKGAPIPQFLEGQLEANIQTSLSRSIGISYQQKVAFPVNTDPGTANEHTITWNEVKVNGAVDVAFPDGNAIVLFQKIIGIELFDRTSEPIPCKKGVASTATPVAVIVTPTSNAVARPPTSTPIPPPILPPTETPPPQPVSTPTRIPPTPLPVNTQTRIPPTSLPVNTPTRIPPTSLPASPEVFDSVDKIPPSGVTTLAVRVNAGEVHAITSGPICVSETGLCLPGGVDGQLRGSVVILLPRNKPYSLTELVPLNNWHVSYYAHSSYARSLAETIAREMMQKSPSNANCSGGCNIVDILIVGSDGIVASYTIKS